MKKALLSTLIGSFLTALTLGADAATISITPTPLTVPAGTATVALSVDGTGFPLDTSFGTMSISWDSTVLTLNSVTYDAIWDPAWNFIFTESPGGISLINFVPDNWLTGAVVGPDFHLMDLVLNVVGGPGTSTAIHMVDGIDPWTRDTGAVVAGVVLQDGQVNVAPVPLPPAIWLLLSGLTGMFAVARRNQAA